MRRHLTLMLITLVVLVAGSTIALAGGGGGGLCAGFGDGQELAMRDNCFEGTGHVVAAGETIVVTNRGELPHTVTAADGTFDSGTIEPGETYELTLEEPGGVPIYCTLHGSADGGGMAGLLAVQGAGLAGAEPASSTAASTGPVWPWLLAGLVLAVGIGATIARLGHRDRPRTDRAEAVQH